MSSALIFGRDLAASSQTDDEHTGSSPQQHVQCLEEPTIMEFSAVNISVSGAANRDGDSTDMSADVIPRGEPVKVDAAFEKQMALWLQQESSRNTLKTLTQSLVNEMQSETEWVDFSEFHTISDNRGFEAKPPQSMYGFVPIFTTIFNGMALRLGSILYLCVFIWSLLAVVVLVQAGFISYIATTVIDTHSTQRAAECVGFSPVAWVLRLLGHTVFASFIWADILESFSFALYIWSFPYYPHSLLHFLERPVLNTTGKMATGYTRASGMSHMFKCLVYIVVLSPKLTVALTLWYYGGGFLNLSENSTSLILNTVALLFILQVDDIIYQGAVSAHLRAKFESLPSKFYGAKLESIVCLIYYALGSFLQLAIIISMAFIALTQFFSPPC